ncbi:hypothetical protein CONCODRAFT_104769 [Conidiobolus coronatus NRRL 28638]|uniref:CUE domain-containing protein n=1 Tax=Conidiobolus coronatus (strain ATCC 28846 / CBS 209.66 / NRRL 28638) TaxID=796925 RepID=A0A137P0R8_CONC2|nr:hypothetical protein CONCODRAFT_104769 [Conidiobolus coronatus NRRL 28638]|eukprot:KXN68474.1 hypothetical protein CONCODRAFT_104769 [Conidiobolus coronatus NRRL 28638]
MLELERVNEYESILETQLKLSNQQFSLKLNNNELITLIEYLLNLPFEKLSPTHPSHNTLKNCYKLIYFTIIRWSSLSLEFMVFKGPSVPLLLSFINTYIHYNFDSVHECIENFLELYPNLNLEFRDFGLELTDYIWRLIKKVEKSNSLQNLNELAQLILVYTKELVKTLNNLELVNASINAEFNLNNEDLLESLVYYYDILSKLVLKGILKGELVAVKVKLLQVIQSTFELKYFTPILTSQDNKFAHVLIDRVIEWNYQFPTPLNAYIGRDTSLFCDLEYYYSWSEKFGKLKEIIKDNGYYSKCEFIADGLQKSLRSAYQPYNSGKPSAGSQTPVNNTNSTINSNVMENPTVNNSSSATLTNSINPPPVPPKEEEIQDTSAQDILDAEQESLITQVKDLFPDLGEGYIQVCLREFNYDLELTIMSILEGNLPPNISSLDKQMSKIK